MRIYLLTLILLLSTFASNAVGREKRFINSPSPTLKVVTADHGQTTYQMLCRGSSAGVYFKNIDSRTINYRRKDL